MRDDITTTNIELWPNRRHPKNSPLWASYGVSVVSKVECHFKGVQYSKILHKWLKELRQNVNQMLDPQKTPHTSPWREYFWENSPRYDGTALYFVESLPYYNGIPLYFLHVQFFTLTCSLMPSCLAWRKEDGFLSRTFFPVSDTEDRCDQMKKEYIWHLIFESCENTCHFDEFI